jgi:hypothetical protein
MLLRVWWREGRRRSLLLPGGWLFPGRNPVEPLSTRQFCRAVHAALQAAGIKKHVSPRLKNAGPYTASTAHPRPASQTLPEKRPLLDLTQWATQRGHP